MSNPIQPTISKRLSNATARKQVLGHDIMDIARFFDDTRHMIVFDVIEDECPVGFSGERIRIFLSEEGYQSAVSAEVRGEMIIRKHYTVKNGDLKIVEAVQGKQKIR